MIRDTAGGTAAHIVAVMLWPKRLGYDDVEHITCTRSKQQLATACIAQMERLSRRAPGRSSSNPTTCRLGWQHCASKTTINADFLLG
jgi:hypothetical protein